MNLINTCAIFLKNYGARHNSMNKLCYAFLNMKKTKNWLRKAMQSFEVHSNESVCRKKGRLGLEQVISNTMVHQKITSLLIIHNKIKIQLLRYLITNIRGTANSLLARIKGLPRAICRIYIF